MVLIKGLMDGIRPRIQFALLISVVVLACVFNFADILASIIKKVGFQNTDLPNYIRVAAAYGRIPLSITIFILVLLWLRHTNKKVIINKDNNTYHKHTYIFYWACASILGYKQCRLKDVPIPMQIKLATNSVFDKLVVDEGVHEAQKNEKIKVTITNDNPLTSTVNIIISDTYKATISQLPGTVLQFTTIEIDRSSGDHMRYLSDKLLKTVTSTIRDLPKTVVEINAFLTTNPSNTYRITKEAFVTAGRDRIKHLYVYQQEREEPRNFEPKRTKIY